VATLLARFDTRVHPSYRMFALVDLTTDNSEALSPSINAAIRAARDGRFGVGWAAGAVSIVTVHDVAPVTVELYLWDGRPDSEPAEAADESDLPVPGGRISVDGSADEALLRGADLPGGGGTYRVRVTGHRRAEASGLYQRAIAEPDEDAASRLFAALAGVETYRFHFWQVSTTPRWEDDDDD
jgi:hypothetical protein